MNDAGNAPKEKDSASQDEENTKILSRHQGTFNRERNAQRDDRLERATDEAFDDGEQYRPEDKAELDERGQPALVYNEIKPTIEWLLGTEKRSRADWKIVARAEDDVKPSQRKTKLMKYISDINAAEFQRSLAFGDAVRSGDGWIKAGVKIDENGRPQIVYEHCNWREFWPDSRARKFDLSDARYLHRARYVDVDDAIRMHPKHEDAILAASKADSAILDNMDGVLESEFQNSGALILSREGRMLVRLVETWYRVPEKVKVIRGEGPLDTTEYVQSPEIDAQVREGGYQLVDAIKNKVRCSVWVDGRLLYDAPSPYKHGLFPYVRVLAYRNKRTGQPYGVIRALRDPQEDLNKRMSKALHALSVRRVLMEKDAVDDINKLAEEVSAPDGVIEYKKGFNLKIEENIPVAQSNLDLASRNSAYIRLASGVTGENLGMETNATSGKAIGLRQEQGAVVTTTLYDNLRQAHIISGKIVLSLIEQFLTEKMQFRITGERGKDEFVTINDGHEDNDITRLAADFVVDEQDWRSSTRAAMSEELIRVAGTLPPQYAILVLDIAFELSDLANKQDIVKRLRKAANLPNPDADGEELQLEQQKEQAMQDAQQAQAQMAMAESQAKVEKAAAEAALLQAKAQREGIVSIKDKLEAVASAVQSAGMVVSNPTLARAADELIAQVDALLNPQQQAAPVVPDQSQPGMFAPSQPPVAGA